MGLPRPSRSPSQALAMTAIDTSLRVPAEEFVRLHEAISFVEPGSYKFARPIWSEFHKMRLLRLSLMPTQVLAMTDFAS